MNTTNPHLNAEIFSAGVQPEKAKAVVVLLHGRGSSAANMLSLFNQLQLTDVSAIAPQAVGNSWYPYSFLAESEQNEPYLESALNLIDQTIKSIAVPASKIVLLGFSQGACLASEYVARNPQKFGGLVILTGGLIGPADKNFAYSGDLQGTATFIGTSNPDAHVPLSRVQQTAQILKNLGAEVELRIYQDMPHIVNEEELECARKIILKAME